MFSRAVAHSGMSSVVSSPVTPRAMPTPATEREREATMPMTASPMPQRSRGPGRASSDTPGGYESDGDAREERADHGDATVRAVPALGDALAVGVRRAQVVVIGFGLGREVVDPHGATRVVVRHRRRCCR